MIRKPLQLLALLLSATLLAACSLGAGTIVDAVPTTGDTANDAAAVQQYLPTIPGYTAVDADSIVDAITAVGGGASLITGNVVTAALVAQIDSMIQCYQNVGAVGAKVYTQVDIAQLIEGQVPSLGALAMINQNRIVNNFIPCALGGLGDSMSAQAEVVQPCTGSGSFVVNNETILYLYVATKQELCTQFEAYIPG